MAYLAERGIPISGIHGAFPILGQVNMDMNMDMNQPNNDNGKRPHDQVTASPSSPSSTRQKACDACVSGKRRCDRQKPQCARCIARGIDCRYKKSSRTAPSKSTSTSTPSPSTSTSPRAANSPPAMTPANSTSCSSGQSDIYPSVSVSEADLEMAGFGLDPMPTATSATTEELQLDPSLGMPELDFFTEPDSLWNMPAFAAAMAASEAKDNLPAVPVRRKIRELPMGDITCSRMDEIDPIEVYDTGTSLGFITASIREMHAKFAQTRELSFLHSRVWSTGPPSSSVALGGDGSWRPTVPRTILTAFSAATAYASRTPQTLPWAMRLVSEAARDIHREGAKPDLTPLDKLARVAALLILAMIRAFDGDIAAAAGVEREMPILEQWITELGQVRDELDQLEPPIEQARRDRPPQSWEVRNPEYRILSSCADCRRAGSSSKASAAPSSLPFASGASSRHSNRIRVSLSLL